MHGYSGGGADCLDVQPWGTPTKWVSPVTVSFEHLNPSSPLLSPSSRCRNRNLVLGVELPLHSLPGLLFRESPAWTGLKDVMEM